MVRRAPEILQKSDRRSDRERERDFPVTPCRLFVPALTPLVGFSSVNGDITPDEALALHECVSDSLRLADFVVLSVQTAHRVQLRKNPEEGVSVRSSVWCFLTGRFGGHPS